MPPARPSSPPPSREARAANEDASDALELLAADHDRAQRLFDRYTELVSAEPDDDDERARVVGEICLLLTVHAQIEEEFFYPAARRALDEEDLVDEAEVEHDSVRELVEELQAMEPLDERYDERVRLLEESFGHHASEEERELFPQVRGSGIDLETLGEQMAARREDLLAELGEPGDGLDDE